MCSHKNLEFIGIQETVHPGRNLHLYTCRSCHSTIAIDPAQVRIGIGRNMPKGEMRRPVPVH